MWKIDNKQNRIIDPNGRIYTAAELSNLAEEVKINSLATETDNQDSTANLNWIELLVAMLNNGMPDKKVKAAAVSPESDLTRVFVKKIDDNTAQLIEFFDDGKVLSSNNFRLPRGKDGLPGANDAYQHYLTQDVNDKSFIFKDYDLQFDHCFYVYLSINANKHRIVGRLEVPAGIDPSYLASNVALDYADTSSVVMIFDASAKTLWVKNWNQNNFVIDKVDVYRKLGNR